MTKLKKEIKFSKKAKATVVSIATATALAIVKSIIGISIGSLAIIASAADSILDIASSSVNFYAIRKSEEPPDENHPFGHSKFESLATFLQSIFIMLSGIYILYKAYEKVTSDIPITNLNAGIGIMLLSIIATFTLSKFLKRVADSERSQVLKADALHYEIDLLTNGGVLISLVVIKFTNFIIIDAIVSVLISFYIIFEALKLSFEVSKDLLDAELPEEDLLQIQKIINNLNDSHIDYHNLRTRRAGSKKFVDMHLTLCRNLPLIEAHDISDQIEAAIKSEINDIDVIIHLDPCSVTDCDKKGTCIRNKNNNVNTSNRPKSID